jgi:hypothetical protein
VSLLTSVLGFGLILTTLVMKAVAKTNAGFRGEREIHTIETPKIR